MKNTDTTHSGSGIRHRGTSSIILNSLKTVIATLLFFSSVPATEAQSIGNDDLQLICHTTRHPSSMADRKVKYGFTPGKRTLNPAYHLLSAGMYAYQRCISPVIARSCAYAPSCSGYSKALIKEYGLLKGTVCTADRLTRCNRISLADPETYRLIDPHDGHIHESTSRYRPR